MDTLDNDIKFVAGVGEARAKLLERELGIRTLGDMLSHYPFRYIDRTRIYRISEITEAAGLSYVQFRARITGVAYAGTGRKRRFTAFAQDPTGQAELVWFQGVKWIEKRIEVGREYLVFGRPSFYRGELSVAHPELETMEQALSRKAESGMQGIYPSTEKLGNVLGAKGMYQIICNAWTLVKDRIADPLPEAVRTRYGLIGLRDAIYNIHFPQSQEALRQAQYRLKFDELLGVQLNIQQRRTERLAKSNGFLFTRVGGVFNTFYTEKLPFPLTGAQKRVIREIRRDTVTGFQMNRLLQGDVGSGKTLVALMSMLLAVDNGFQACMMAPTEILARQHYATVCKMLDGMDVKVAVLTGASKARERRASLEGIASGEVDILIGTHRIVGKDVKFKDLGLLVVDEEQKFGVAVKEKLKQMKVNVDTITMSATPIPRTLQFSLMGARDLSSLNTPPANRYPIMTSVNTLNDDILSEAVNFELSRNGQVFIINNRIEGLYQLEAMVKRVCPDAKTLVAHGQLPPEQLEKSIIDFANHDYDVLLATTIVESGIDMPNVNTIIVNNAQNFGLSELHQLRGRVGRSSRKAFCYLMVPPGNPLSPVARRRLQAIESFSDLGSGIHIAMQDLDIRGAGNLLGAEQSGFIADLGYETYQKILKEAVTELRTQEFADSKDLAADSADGDQEYVADCVIESDLELLLPATYVPQESERISLYRELDSIDRERDLEEFRKNLIDRFGEIPAETEELMRVPRLRRLARQLGIEKVTLKQGVMYLYFVDDSNKAYYQSPMFGRLVTYLQQNPKRVQIRERNGRRSFAVQSVKSVEQAVGILKEVTSLPVA